MLRQRMHAEDQTLIIFNSYKFFVVGMDLLLYCRGVMGNDDSVTWKFAVSAVNGCLFFYACSIL